MVLEGGLTSPNGPSTTSDSSSDDSKDVEGGLSASEALSKGIQEKGARVTTTDKETGETTILRDDLDDDVDPLESGSDASYAGDGPSDSVRATVAEADEGVTRGSAGLTDSSTSEASTSASSDSAGLDGLVSRAREFVDDNAETITVIGAGIGAAAALRGGGDG